MEKFVLKGNVIFFFFEQRKGDILK